MSAETEKASPWSAAVVGAQATAQAVGKDARNNHHGYRYASAEAIIEEARNALSSAGLAVFCLGFTFTDKPGHNQEGHGERGMLTVTFVVEHTSGERREFTFPQPVLCEKGRPLDKGVAAARTYALSYFLRDFLLLPRVDESEVDRRDDRPREERTAPPREPQRAKPEPPVADGATFEALAKRLAEAQTGAELSAVGKEIAQTRISDAQRDALKAAYGERREAIAASKPKEAA